MRAVHKLRTRSVGRRWRLAVIAVVAALLAAPLGIVVGEHLAGTSAAAKPGLTLSPQEKAQAQSAGLTPDRAIAVAERLGLSPQEVQRRLHYMARDQRWADQAQRKGAVESADVQNSLSQDPIPKSNLDRCASFLQDGKSDTEDYLCEVVVRKEAGELPPGDYTGPQMESALDTARSKATLPQAIKDAQGNEDVQGN